MAGFLETALGITNPWAAVIAGGLQWYGAKKAGDAQVDAANAYNATVTEAAKPKDVIDPTASVVWDEETQTYVLAPSPPMMGLFGANLQDAYRQRALIEDYMKDPEAAARARMEKTAAAMLPYRQREGQGLLSQLLKKGTAGSTMGIAAMEERDISNALYDATRLDAERAGVQGDITNYINRSNMAAQNAERYGSIGQNLANLGIGLGSNAYAAASEGGTGLMNAQANAGFNQAQLPYSLGQHMMGYATADPYEQLRIQNSTAVGSQAPANLYNRF
jgi:hypothetical protein|tara:strand:- start:3375 stop:4202 length:828 start_codon:yes stop_codon:yes gene_type:complete